MSTPTSTQFTRSDLYKVLVLLVIVLAALAVFSAIYIVPARGNRFDFYPRWQGGQMIWRGESPYTQAATEAIQRGMFGGVLPPDVDQQRMVYPAYVGILLAPLLVLPAPTAIAIWLALQFLAILATPILWLQITGWKPPPWVLGLLIVGLVLVYRYPINLYIVGQFVGTALLGFSLAVFLLQQKRDVSAGIVLAVTAVPPTIAIPLAVLLLGGFVLRGRWRGAASFVATLLILTLITFVQIGWWIPDFLAQIGSYSSYAAPIWAPGLLESAILRWALILGAIAITLFALYRFRQTGRIANFAVTLCIVCLLLLPQTGNYYLALLIPALLVITSRGSILRRVGVLLAIAAPWLMRSLPDPTLEALLLPLYVLILWLPDLLDSSPHDAA
jgi:hypothetical protein